MLHIIISIVDMKTIEKAEFHIAVNRVTKLLIIPRSICIRTGRRVPIGIDSAMSVDPFAC